MTDSKKSLSRRDFLRLAGVAAGAAAAAGVTLPVGAAPKAKMATPTITCSGIAQGASIDISVCAGATGAPAGFSIQWITEAAYLATGWPLSDSLDLCKASFSGNANGSSYNLAPNACTVVNIGDNLFDDPGASSNCVNIPLQCGTRYVFRVFAHANSTLNRSDFTPTLTCSTADCGGGGCTFTQGYWKTHGPIPTGNNTNVWPVTSLTLGSVSYTDLELQAIFDTQAGGNGLISLAHQLIAAKLNVANGADDSAIAAAIAAADALIGSLVVPPVGSGSLAPSDTSALTGTLDGYNQGTTGPGHCQ